MAFTLDRSRPGAWLSGIAHVALLAAGLVAFAADKLPDAEEGIPVEIVTDNQLSQITRGETNARQVTPDPKPRVDRQADTRVERDPGDAKQDAPSPPKRPVEAKLADDEAEPAPTPPKKPEVKPEVAKVEPPPTPQPPTRPDTRAADAAKAEAAKAKAEAEAIRLAEAEKAEEQARSAKAAEAAKVAAAKAKAEAEAKADLERKVHEAEAREKAEQRRKVAEAKVAKAKAEAEARARKQAETADRFSPGDISRILSSKEPTAAAGSTGRELQRTASLGTATGSAARLNPSQRDQIAGLIREQLIRCWQPPVAVQTAAKPPTATVRLALAQDGSLSGDPVLMNSSSDPLFRPVADSAMRATRRCAPLRIPAQFIPFYQDWKDLVVEFDPRQLS